MAYTKMPWGERLRIGARLDGVHKLFYTFFELAGVYYNDEVARACVKFVKDQPPVMELNPTWFNEQTDDFQDFVIAHECLHVMLRHDLRHGQSVPGATQVLVNQAQDIVINHIIEDLIGIKRGRDIPHEVWTKYCWIETLFKDPSDIKPRQRFEYYLEKLIEQGEDSPDNSPTTVDDHSDDDDSVDNDSGAIDDLVERLSGTLTGKELDRLAEAGDQLEGIISRQAKEREIVGLSIDALVKSYKRRTLAIGHIEEDSFCAESRRVDRRTTGIKLPGAHEVYRFSHQKLSIALFMDVSGSCIRNFDTFVAIVNKFKVVPDLIVRTFTFDTGVREVDLKSQVKIGGGTTFKQVNEAVEKLACQGRYPDLVIVITDGDNSDGALVVSQPKRWLWLLSPPMQSHNIPSTSKIYNLSHVNLG